MAGPRETPNTRDENLTVTTSNTLTPTDRLPPHSKQAEAAVLGALLNENRAFDDVAGVIGPGDFLYAAHVTIARIVWDELGAGRRIDLVLLNEKLKAAGRAEDVGGPAYLAELWDAAPTAANAAYYAKEVRGLALRRNLIHAANEIVRDAYDGHDEPDALAAEAERRVIDVGANLLTATDPDPADVVTRRCVADLEDRMRGGGRMTGAPSGFPDLDRMTDGFQPGTLTILAARPSVGKTALALAWTLAAARAGIKTRFVSLEMSTDDLFQRLLAMTSGTPLMRIRTGRGMVDDDLERIGRQVTSSGLAGLPIEVDDTPGQTITRITATARRAVRRRGVKLLVVDYLQLIATDTTRKIQRYELLGEISRRLKLLARECQIPVIALAQLNRGPEDRPDGRPRLSDLRESGNLEQDADVVSLLWKRKDDDSLPVADVGLILAKQRNGATGDIDLRFRKSCARFEGAAEPALR